MSTLGGIGDNNPNRDLADSIIAEHPEMFLLLLPGNYVLDAIEELANDGNIDVRVVSASKKIHGRMMMLVRRGIRDEAVQRVANKRFALILNR